MTFFGSVQLAIDDLGNELKFRMTREDGWFELIAGPAAIVGLLFFAWIHASAWFLVFGGAGLVSLIVNWIRGRETVLRVTSEELIAEGNLASLFSSEIRIPVSQIESIDWRAPNDGDSGGLFVRSGWSSSYVLPGLTQELARTVTDAIFRRFPDLPIRENGPASLLFGDGSGLTTLGLARRNDQQGG